MRRIDRRRAAAPVERGAFPGLRLQEYMTFLGRQYGLSGSHGSTPEATFVGYVRGIAERNGVVAGAVAARALLVSQTRFTWRNNRTSPTPGRLFGDRSLEILERPGPVTRPELLHLAEKDVSYAGSWIAHRAGNQLRRLRPDGVTVVMGSESGPVDDWVPSDAEITGYVYKNPNGGQSARAEAFLPDEIVHWKPEPHPLEWWRGEAWVTSVMDEIRNDGQATDHTSKFFDNAATPRLIFTMDPTLTPAQVEEYASVANKLHAGTRNAYKNMYLGGAVGDVKVVGSEVAALQLKDIQGGYETRIAARSRVPAVVLGIREGLGGSALNSGNYSTARRLWSDGWYTPTIQGLCASVERVMRPAPDAELWYDASEVYFLQEDAKDEADIQNTKAAAIRQLVDAGYKPETVVAAIENNDYKLLEHSDLFSVQLQAPGSGTDATSDADGKPA